VVAHVAVSVDGATTGFAPDQRLFYELAGTWREDVTLVGADTILAQEPALARIPARPPTVRCSRWWTGVGGCGSGRRCARSDTGPTCSRCTPRAPLRGRPIAPCASWWWVTSGWIWRRRSSTWVDPAPPWCGWTTGGALIAALLSAALLDELSLLVHPLLVPAATRWFGAGPCPFALLAAEPVGDGLVWVRYRPR
jgi:2,5-diamino-6-(ribosylamino)-4(3H)-pyrimidinone 5'-phosphate reductase